MVTRLGYILDTNTNKLDLFYDMIKFKRKLFFWLAVIYALISIFIICHMEQRSAHKWGNAKTTTLLRSNTTFFLEGKKRFLNYFKSLAHCKWKHTQHLFGSTSRCITRKFLHQWQNWVIHTKYPGKLSFRGYN